MSALIPGERVIAGLAAAKRRGCKGGRPPAIGPERVGQIVSALKGGASKASVCRSFKVARSTLLDMLARIGWTGAAITGAEASAQEILQCGQDAAAIVA